MDLETMLADGQILSSLRIQLSQITAASQMLERTAVTPRDIGYLAAINQNICRMMRLVGQMELCQRLASPEETTLEPTSLSELVSELGSHVESILKGIGVEFLYDCPDALFLRSNRRLLQQLLLEMVFYLAVTATHISLTVTEQDRTVTLTLRDQGPGESEQRTRLPAALQHNEEQIGIDLARKITQHLGGSFMESGDSAQRLTLTAAFPAEKPGRNLLFRSPRTTFAGGLDPALIALSPLLPAKSFRPDNVE